MEDKKRVLVTGGAGYIGSHTAVELIEAGYEVVILDNLINSSEQAVEGVRAITCEKVPFEKADCTDRKAMERIFNKYKFHAVVHFAALKSVIESRERPIEYYSNNVGSFTNILIMSYLHSVRNIVYSSSCCVYGILQQQPLTEETPIQAAFTPYSRSKHMCEEILRDAITGHPGMRGISLRYCNPIGAHPSGLIGEWPMGTPDDLVPYLTPVRAGLDNVVKIYGGDYNTPDGTALRDYLDIVDLSKAHVKALDRLFEDRYRYEVFNIGAGRPISVMEIISTFEKVSGLKIKYEVVGRRPGSIEAMWCDPSRAKNELGWEPERTLEQTLAAAWVWEKKIQNIK